MYEGGRDKMGIEKKTGVEEKEVALIKIYCMYVSVNNKETQIK